MLHRSPGGYGTAWYVAAALSAWESAHWIRTSSVFGAHHSNLLMVPGYNRTCPRRRPFATGPAEGRRCLDILINNAVIRRVSWLAGEPDTATTRYLEINLRGVIHGTRGAVRRMRPRRRRAHRQHIRHRRHHRQVRRRHLQRHQVRADRPVGDGPRRAARHQRAHLLRGDPLVRTDMTVGFDEARLTKAIPAETVAASIIDTLRCPRSDVLIPHRLAAMHYTVKRLLPVPSASLRRASCAPTGSCSPRSAPRTRRLLTADLPAALTRPHTVGATRRRRWLRSPVRGSGHHRDCWCEAPGDRPPSSRDVDPDRQRQLSRLWYEVGSPVREHLE